MSSVMRWTKQQVPLALAGKASIAMIQGITTTIIIIIIIIMIKGHDIGTTSMSY